MAADGGRGVGVRGSGRPPLKPLRRCWVGPSGSKAASELIDRPVDTARLSGYDTNTRSIQVVLGSDVGPGDGPRGWERAWAWEPSWRRWMPLWRRWWADPIHRCGRVRTRRCWWRCSPGSSGGRRRARRWRRGGWPTPGCGRLRGSVRRRIGWLAGRGRRWARRPPRSKRPSGWRCWRPPGRRLWPGSSRRSRPGRSLRPPPVTRSGRRRCWPGRPRTRCWGCVRRAGRRWPPTAAMTPRRTGRCIAAGTSSTGSMRTAAPG